jgi:hypothetical protein
VKKIRYGILLIMANSPQLETNQGLIVSIVLKYPNTASEMKNKK